MAYWIHLHRCGYVGTVPTYMSYCIYLHITAIVIYLYFSVINCHQCNYIYLYREIAAILGSTDYKYRYWSGRVGYLQSEDEEERHHGLLATGQAA